MKLPLTGHSLAAAGLTFALAVTGLAAAPVARAEDLGEDDDKVVTVHDDQSEFDIQAPTITANAADSQPHALGTQVQQSEIDALAAGTQTNSQPNRTSIIVAIIAAIAGFAGAAALVNNFFGVQ